VKVRGICVVRTLSIEGIEVTRAILGCDSFVSWLYQSVDSPFKGSDGKIDRLKTLEVMKASVDQGVRCIDLSPPMIDAFSVLQDETDCNIEALGALQEWTCKNFVIDDVPLADYGERIMVNMRSNLPPRYLSLLEHSDAPRSSFIRSFFELKTLAEPLTESEIGRIRMKPDFFEKRLELYRKMSLKLVQFGGGTADWLVALGREDLLKDLSRLIRMKGFAPILICHWTSLVLPVAEKGLDVAGYVVPVNRLWGLLTLSEALETIRSVEKPVIAMKTLAQGALAHDLQDAFTYLFKKAKVAGVLVGVSSVAEAKQTFSTLARVLDSDSKHRSTDSQEQC
jgi:hypothetical protein